MAKDLTRLPGLDALRGIAALMVAIMHADVVFGDGELLKSAGLMVDFFFMLSGYVMARTYETKMRAGIGPVTFTVLRFRRLWPPIAIGIGIGLFLYQLLGMNPLQLAVLLAFAMLFLPNMIAPAEPFALNPPQWSITFELLGNFLHAWILWRLDVRRLVVLTIACGILLMTWPRMDIRDTPWSLLHAVPRLLLPYIIGIILWRIVRDKPPLPIWVALVGLPLTEPICTFGRSLIGAHSYVLLIIVVLPVILVAGLAPITSIIARRTAATIGALSFPLYAIHSPVLMLVQLLGGGKWPALLLSLGLSVLISIVVEKRFFTAFAPERAALPPKGLMATAAQGTEEPG